MDRINSEISEENTFTDRTNKRRISSILKAPRTPLRDLGCGNELNQECVVEKHQKNPRRVSFADTIRVFPTDPQTIVESNNEVTTEEPRQQNTFIKNEELEVPCEITGMNTLLHAPIQTSLQQTEVFYANGGPEWNSMNKTFIFSEENEMDMTSGHTIIITHDFKNGQETDNTGKIDFKSFSAELKSKKETSQVNKFNCFSGPTMNNDTCLSRHKTNTENTQKIIVSDFVKMLKSTSTADIASKDNVLQEEKYNAVTISKGLNDNKQNYILPILSNKESSFASKQLVFQELTPAPQKESENTAHRKRSLPLGFNTFNSVNEQENRQRDNSVSRLNTSNYQLDFQLDPNMCINEKHMNRTEANSGQKNSMVTKNDTVLPCYENSAMLVPTGSVTSPSVLPKDTTTFLNFSAHIEMTRKRSGLIWEDNSKRTGYPVHRDPKEQNDIFQLNRKTTCKEGHMDISTDYFHKNPQHSIYGNEKVAPNEEVIYNMGLLNPRIKDVPQATYLHEKKENDRFHGNDINRPSVFFPENGSLSSNFISTGSRKQSESQFLSLSDYKSPAAVYSKINRKSGLSNSAESLSPEVLKSATLVFNQTMDITKCITNLTNNPDAAVFQNMSQEERGTGTKIVTELDSNKTVLFSLTGYDDMEITKNHTVPVNFDMRQHERTPQPPSLQFTDKAMYMYHSDMDETKAITGIICQPMENLKDPEIHKQTDESVRRILSGTTDDRYTVFSLSNEDGMEISRSHTVALGHDVVTQGGEISTMSFVPSSKMDAFAFGENIDIANPIAGLTDKPLRSVPDPFPVLEQKAKPGERISGLTSAKIIHSLKEDNETIPVDRCMVTVEEAPQAPSSVLPEKAMSVHRHSMAKDQALPSVTTDKTEFFLHNNDMEITKPVICRSLQDTGFKNMDWTIQRTGKMLSETAKEKTATQLEEVSEMEITRGHTVAVNHAILQQVQLTTQDLISAPAVKTNMPIHSSDTTTTQSTRSVPVDKTVFVNNNNMEVTKSESAAFLKNSCSAYLSQRGKETKEITLSGSIEDKTSVLALHGDEMEMAKYHTDVFPKFENLPQELFSQNNMDITKSHTITENAEENLHNNVTKFGNHAQWDLTSKRTVALAIDDMDVTERHKIIFNCKRSLHYLPYSQPKLPFSVNDTNTSISYQDGTKVSNSQTNAVGNRDMEDSVRQMSKNIQQNSVNILPIAYGGKTQDTEFPENHTVTINGCNNMPGIENQTQNMFTNSRDYSENIEMTRNYTTGIECVHMNDKNECYLNSQAKSNTEFSASALTHEKKLYTGISQTEKDVYSTCSDADMLLLPQEQQNVLKTKENQLRFCIADMNNFGKDATLHSVPSEQNDPIFLVNRQDLDPKLSEENAHDFNTGKMCIPMRESKSSEDDPKSWPGQGPPRETTDLSNKVTNTCESVSSERNSHNKDLQKNVQSFPNNTFLSEEKSIFPHKISDAAATCLNLKHTGKKSQPDLVCQDVESGLRGALPGLTVQTDVPSVSMEDVKEPNIFTKNWSNTGFTESPFFKVPLNTECRDSCKIKKIPLGIFPPKLPNKRKSLLTNVDGTAAKSEKRTEIHDSEVGFLVKGSFDKIIADLSPSSYINQELLPAYVEGMDSDESLNYNVPEKICEVMTGKEATEEEGQLSEMYETNKRQRALYQEGEEHQQEKKFKGNKNGDDPAHLTQPLTSTMVADNQAKTFKPKNVPEITVINLEKTESSSSSNSLDSIKAEADFSIQQNTERETHFLLDSICDQNLPEKLQEGTITVREFFTLLEVHVLIQKPRQSQLPFKYEVNTPPTLEDEILRQYIYHPKLQTYKEDCQSLDKTIEELKSHAIDQDKLLVNVHKSLWEVMRTCSHEELKGFGAELNKMKSCFTKKSKVLAHRRKAELYDKLAQNAQLQWEKLQSRLTKIDELLKETDSCLVALETEITLIEECDLNVNNAISEYESKLRNTERELENLQAQDEASHRAQSSLIDKKKQMVSEICRIQTDVKTCEDIVEKYNFSEWTIKEWNDHQAVFTFLDDSIELTVGLACPVGGAIFSNKIVSVNFESVLDEATASPSSKLVHRLIFQFIDSQGSWQEKCLSVHQLFQILHDVSLVVSRCHFLAEEIEFLNRWGGKYYLLKTELNGTKLKLLFSSSHGKFEIEFSLSAEYPVTPGAFAIEKYTGSLVQEEISVVLSSVPVGANYLRRIVKQISDSLLQCRSSTVYKKQSSAV